MHYMYKITSVKSGHSGRWETAHARETRYSIVRAHDWHLLGLSAREQLHWMRSILHVFTMALAGTRWQSLPLHVEPLTDPLSAAGTCWNFLLANN